MSSTYCTAAELGLDYGDNALTDYATIDGDSDNATTRQTEAIVLAGEWIDAALRVSKYQYKLPITDPSGSTPVLINRIARALAMCYIYDSGGARKMNQAGEPVHQYEFRRGWALEMLEQIRTDKLRLDALC
jgi:hypothetical protein